MGLLSTAIEKNMPAYVGNTRTTGLIGAAKFRTTGDAGLKGYDAMTLLFLEGHRSPYDT